MKITVFSKKAFKDLHLIEAKRPKDVDFIEKECEKHLIEPFKADGNKIKEFTNYNPPLFRLRINAIESYRVYLRIYENCFFIERIVSKKDSEKVLKNII